MPSPLENAPQSLKNLHELGRESSLRVSARPFSAEVLPEWGLATETEDLLRFILLLNPDSGPRHDKSLILSCLQLQE